MTEKQFQKLMRAANDIVWYAEKVIGIELEDYQKAVLKDVQDYDRVAWRSGHGVGKTTTSAIVVNWFFDTFSDSKVITTASSWRQVSKMLWPEIHKWRRQADLESIGVHDYEGLNLMLKRGEDWFATGEASDVPEKMEGFHSKNILYVVDEGKSVPNRTYEAIEGALTTRNAKILIISTPPAEKAGYFWEVFSRKRRGWRLHHTNSETSKRVSKEWIEARKLEWGVESPIYQTRVKGEFSEVSDDLLIPLTWVEKAINKECEDGTIHIGGDIARFGADETSMFVRSGNKIIHFESYSKEDTMQTVGRFKLLIERFKPKSVKIDVIGVGGGVVDRLKEMGYNEVIGVNVGEKASDSERFINLRAEVFWSLRELFRDEDVSVPDDERLIGQLSNIKYKFNSRGQTQIESKDDIKKRGLKSPDRADALALCYYQPIVNKPEIIII